MNPLVSVIIPCFNSEKFITSTIKSVINQSYKNIEIIVVDDGSTDTSAVLINEFGNNIIYIKKSNQGVSAARNTGLKIAKGEYIKFLDADDILLPDAIKAQVNDSHRYKEQDNVIIYGYLNRINEDSTKIWAPKSEKIKTDGDQIPFLIENNFIVTSCPLYRKSFLFQVGGFNEKFVIGEEQELHIKLHLIGIRFIYYPTLVYYYRDHQSVSRLSSNKWQSKNPYFGMQQLKYLEELIISHRKKLSIEISTAFFHRHISYARSLAKFDSYGFSKEHLLRAKTLNVKIISFIKMRHLKNYIFYIVFKYCGEDLALKLAKVI